MTTTRDLAGILASRVTLVWIRTREERRVRAGLQDAAAMAQYEVGFWDCCRGLVDQDPEGRPRSQPQLAAPAAILERIRDSTDRKVVVLLDFHKWLGPIELRSLRNLVQDLQGAPSVRSRLVVITAPENEAVPPELTGHATVLDWPLPDRAEMGRVLDAVLLSAPDAEVPREAAVDAAVGLTAEEAANCYARSLVATRGAKIDPALVVNEKKRVIARERVLTWYEPDPRGLDGIGGLDLLKSWLMVRRQAFSQAARDFGLPAPKGMLLVGPPGTGKSLTAKAVAAAWGVPLLRLDLGALKSKYVGDSEGNIRKALGLAEAVAPSILWIDEIEKALAGATGPQGDGGVSSDALGAILSWMQEHTASVFVIATANDVAALPPELLRKGRFDELFFVDLPTAADREAILRSCTGRVALGAVDFAAVAAATRDFTGAELVDGVVPDALFAAFNDGARPLTTEDLLTAARAVVPLARQAGEKIARLREWAKGRCRWAATAEVAPAPVAGIAARVLDL